MHTVFNSYKSNCVIFRFTLLFFFLWRLFFRFQIWVWVLSDTKFIWILWLSRMTHWFVKWRIQCTICFWLISSPRTWPYLIKSSWFLWMLRWKIIISIIAWSIFQSTVSIRYSLMVSCHTLYLISCLELSIAILLHKFLLLFLILIFGAAISRFHKKVFFLAISS